MKEKLSFIDELRDYTSMPEKVSEILNMMQILVNTDSTYDRDSASHINPYGVKISRAFEKLSKTVKEMGFTLNIYDNRVADVVIGNPNASRSLGVLAHLDVVTVDASWPKGFMMQIEDGIVYGRGVSDDKGPLLINLVVLRDYYRNNAQFLDEKDFNIRLIIGGDEERGSSCAEYYFNELKKPILEYGYTPDGEFPVVYGEKGMLGIKMSGPIDGGILLEAKTTNATNVVPSSVKLTFSAASSGRVSTLISKRDMTFSEDELSYDVSIRGVSAHASLCDLGENAIVNALDFLNGAGVVALPNFQKIFPNNLGLNVDPNDTPEAELGKLTANLGSFNYNNGQVAFFIDVRYNEKTNVEKFINHIQTLASPLKVELVRNDNPLLIDKNSRFIQTLIDSYIVATGDVTAKPVTKGGGTYAKHAKNVVAFGPQFIGTNNHIHEDRELIAVSEIEKLYRIYYLAIENLVRLLDEN